MTDEQPLESWKNTSAGRVVFKRVDRLTGRTTEQMITSGKTFHATPEERRRYESECASEELNPFRNGIFQAIKLIDTEEDAREIAEGVNSISDGDIDALFAGHWKTFEARINSITSPFTIRRIKDRGTELDATVRQMAVIDARLREVSGETGADIESTTVGSVGASAIDQPAGQFRPISA